MGVIKLCILAFRQHQHLLTQWFRKTAVRGSTSIPVDEALDPYVTNRSPNPFPLPVGHTYFL
jgi:hypothetical protein